METVVNGEQFVSLRRPNMAFMVVRNTVTVFPVVTMVIHTSLMGVSLVVKKSIQKCAQSKTDKHTLSCMILISSEIHSKSKKKKKPSKGSKYNHVYNLYSNLNTLSTKWRTITFPSSKFGSACLTIAPA